MTKLNQAIQRLKELMDSVHGADACKLAWAIELLEEHRQEVERVFAGSPAAAERVK